MIEDVQGNLWLTTRISLSQEINTLAPYIDQEQIRFINPFKFVIELDEKLHMNKDKKFVITIIDLKDENNISAGTEVQLIIPFNL